MKKPNPIEQKQFTARSQEVKSPETEPEVDENGLPKELWPHRDEMKKWSESHRDDVNAFLEYKNAIFKLIYGQGFYHQPGKDIISLSVPWYRECKDSGKMTENQIHFGEFHEFAHLKTMWELDRTGKLNHLEQYNYEANKVIRDKEDPTRFVNLQPSYRQFYNILEDTIVNDLVLSNRVFSQSVGGESKKRNQEIRKLYTDQFFPIFKNVGESQGSYIVNPDPEKIKEEPFIFVGKGKGNLEILDKEDYEQGFDWNAMEPKMNRSGQFLTFFIKNQMIGLKESDVFDPEQNPTGKFKLNPDVALALTKHLAEVYEILLKKIVDKYQDDPAQMKRYAEFMSQVIKIPRYQEQDNKIIEDMPSLVENVVNPNCVTSDNKINITRAKVYFKEKLKGRAALLGIKDISSAKFLDLFNRYKDLKKSKEYSWTFPLKCNLETRTQITRDTLEKIFTMLCVLDDSFDVAMPPEQEPNGPSKSKGPESSPEKPEWKKGDKVLNLKNNKKGIITDVKYGSSGEVVSATVEYYEEIEKEQMAMNLQKKDIKLTGESEEVFNPNENLALIAKKPKKGEKGQQEEKDPRKKAYEEGEEEKEEEKDQEESESEGDKKQGEKKEGEESEEGKEKEGGEEDKEGKEGKKDQKKTKPGKGGGAKQKDKDAGDIADPYKKYLEDLIAQDEGEANLDEVEKQKKSSEYQDKKAELDKAKDLAKKLKQAMGKQGESKSGGEFSDKKIIEKYQELEKIIAPYADKMAQTWLEVVNNIASKIEAIKDKYYRTGKPDIKKLQKHLPEIELGMDIDDRLIYEQIIEKIKTELRPKMLRVILAIDNSGSMGSFIDSVRMAVMLLNSSLRSFRILFKDQMKDILGTDYTEDIDLTCDTEIRLFGDRQSLIKKFDVADFNFLENKDMPVPEIDVNKETINTILAFQKITCHEGTRDGDLWTEINLSHQNKKIQELLKENKMTEIIFQISDGDIADTETAKPLIQNIKKMGVGIVGFAIGNNGVSYLSERHGRENVIEADTPQQIVEQFGGLLKKIIVEQIQKPMEEYLESLQE